MKILSVIVPSYNSEKFMSKCIESLIESGEGIEILLVNDGSTDRTDEVANQYSQLYPDKIRVIHQENSGHGGAVNTGIAQAEGHYIKVVDSDDWVNPKVLRGIVKQLNMFIITNTKVDMVLSNFVYDKEGVKEKKVMNYRGIIPQNQVVTWSELGRFKTSKYILMHSVIYSAEVLKKCGLVLPKHTFYVDNLFVYLPLAYVEKLYYIDECLYHYLIGRDEQSVNEETMIRRIDQQLLVNKLMVSTVDLSMIRDKSKKRYMMHYVNIVTTVSTVLLYKSDSEDAALKRKELWSYIKAFDPYLYFRMRGSLLGSIINIPGTTGKYISLFAYKVAKQKVGFN